MIKNELTIIAAASTNNVIGLDNKLIWNIPKDLKKISTNKIKKMLEKSIQNEEYIMAAKLRDELNIRKSIK